MSGHDMLINFKVTDALLKQKECHDALVSELNNKIKHLDKWNDSLGERMDIVYSYFCDMPEERLKEYVEYAYSKFPEEAKRLVEAFHDNGEYDLTSIECAKKDFTPWD